MALKQGSIFPSVLLCSLLSTASAAINNWTNTAGGSWEDTNNWSLGVLPDNTTTTRINAAGTYTVTVDDNTTTTAPLSFTNARFEVHSAAAGEPTLDFNYTEALNFRVNGNLELGDATLNWNAPNATFSVGGSFNTHSTSFGSNSTINIHGGSVVANGALVIAAAAGSTSTMNIHTGGVFTLTSSNSRLGNNGLGIINIQGGRLNISNTLQLGQAGSGTGRVVLVDGLISMAGGGAQLSIGSGPNQSANSGYGEVIISNGTLTGSGEIRVGSGPQATGVLNVYGGSITQGGLLRVGYGLQATASTNFPQGLATGTVNFVNGNWAALNSWFIGAGSNSVGTMNMSGGTGSFNAGGIHVQVGQANYSSGQFNMTGGLLSFTNTGAATAPSFQIANGSNSVGVLHMTGGTIQIVNTGAGLLIGTNEHASGLALLEGGRVELRTLNVGAGGVLSNRAGGLLQFVGIDNVLGSGSKIVDGGTLSYKNYAALTVSVAAAKFNIVSGSGLQLDSSTNVNIAGTFNLTNSAGNFKELSLTGNGPLWRSDNLLITDGSRLHVTNASNARLTSVVDNQGTILVQDSTVTYLNTVNVGGRYISDPSTNTFNEDVTVDLGGTLEGGIGDLFDFKKDLFIQSTNHTVFDLDSSSVRFSGGGNHTNSITGGDFGSNAFFSANNFGYGQLTLGSASDHVFFTSGNGALSNALYAQFVDLLGTTNNVANLHAPTGINIYYLLSEHDTRNAYLMDLTYVLDGGGLLLPAIPEPSITALVILAGLPFLLRRK